MAIGKIDTGGFLYSNSPVDQSPSRFDSNMTTNCKRFQRKKREIKKGDAILSVLPWCCISLVAALSKVDKLNGAPDSYFFVF